VRVLDRSLKRGNRKMVTVEEQPVVLDILDTAGQEEFRYIFLISKIAFVRLCGLC
jgi:hypothetical protein